MPRHLSKTASGTLAHIRIDGVLHRKHFPKGTDPTVMRQWLLSVELRHRGQKRRKTGRFEDDARVYLETVKAMPTIDQRRQHIEEWIGVFGSTPRHQITAADIRAQLHAWRSTVRTVSLRSAKNGPKRSRSVTLSAAACNKRRTALMHLFTVLDGRSMPNPVKDVPKFAEPTPQPRALTYDTIRKILAAVPEKKSRARLAVMAYTGLTPAQIMSLTAENVDLQRATVAVPGRKKGAGTKGRVYPLVPKAVEAFRLMASAKAWGRFTHTPLRKAFRRACTTAGLVAGRLTPYDLRHSFGTEVYRRSGDIRATAALMGHSTLQMTQRYTLAAVDERALSALKDFGE